MYLKDVTARLISNHTGVSASVCLAFLAEMQQRLPRATLYLAPVSRDAAIASKKHDGVVMVLSPLKEFAVITVGGEILVPEGGIKNRPAAQMYAQTMGARLVPDNQLATVISQLAKPYFQSRKRPWSRRG